MSFFDSEGLGEIETATRYEDVYENDVKIVQPNEYEGNHYYFSCGTIHPSFALFIPAVPKHIVDEQMKRIRSEKESNNAEVKFKAMNECISVLMGTNNTFQKYIGKGGVRLLERYASEGKQEYKDFCNDVILYNIFMSVYFNKPVALWDLNQVKELGLYRD